MPSISQKAFSSTLSLHQSRPLTSSAKNVGREDSFCLTVSLGQRLSYGADLEFHPQTRSSGRPATHKGYCRVKGPLQEEGCCTPSRACWQPSPQDSRTAGQHVKEKQDTRARFQLLTQPNKRKQKLFFIAVQVHITF